MTAWQYVQDALGRYFEYVMAHAYGIRPKLATTQSLWDLAAGPVPQAAQDLLGGFLEWIELFGRRTGELHAALMSDPKDAAFAPSRSRSSTSDRFINRLASLRCRRFTGCERRSNRCLRTFNQSPHRC